MKLKKCKHCNEEIAKNAKVCPKCGARFGLPGWAKIIIVLIIIFGCVVACVSGCTNSVNDAIDDTKNSYKDINGKTSFNLNETFQNKHEKITMTESNLNFKNYSEYLKPADGNKVIMVKFEVENISEDSDEAYVSSLNFNGYADGVAISQFYSGNDKYNDLSATIGKGKKSIGYIFYEVPKDAKNITIEYKADFWTDGTNIEFIVQK